MPNGQNEIRFRELGRKKGETVETILGKKSGTGLKIDQKYQVDEKESCA